MNKIQPTCRNGAALVTLSQPATTDKAGQNSPSTLAFCSALARAELSVQPQFEHLGFRLEDYDYQALIERTLADLAHLSVVHELDFPSLAQAAHAASEAEFAACLCASSRRVRSHVSYILGSDDKAGK